MQINSYLIVYHYRLLDIGPTFTTLGMAREGTVLPFEHGNATQSTKQHKFTT
jgi:hypothetical protein